MAYERSAAVGYANEFWDVPCDDGKVESIPYQAELVDARKKVAEPDKWMPVFLRNYGAGKSEELYLIPKARYLEIGPNDLVTRLYDKNTVADKIFMHGWSGLLDCAHFVSRCLQRGSLSINTGSVPILVSQLRDGRSDTKTLGLELERPDALRILDSQIMTAGDVLCYLAPEGGYHYEHSALYMGGGKIACHTLCRHPTFDGDWHLHHDNWQYTLIHFNQGDTLCSWLPGWWKVLWRQQEYYYYFDGSGSVVWATRPPISVKLRPTVSDGKGYWFCEGDWKITICWTQTSSVEKYFKISDANALNGTWNDSDQLKATRLSGST